MRTSHVIQAAIAGEGVALGRSALVAADIAAGRLVKPFEFSLPGEYRFYFVCLAGGIERPKIAAFRHWLFEEKRRADELSETLARRPG
jgi:LysR family glycine cleavage system transcriptional activator